jgi:hypothetical protein
MNKRLVDHCVETLCDKGCKAVWLDIHRLEAGENLPETVCLDDRERRAVLDELKAVMTVYSDGSCQFDEPS